MDYLNEDLGAINVQLTPADLSEFKPLSQSSKFGHIIVAKSVHLGEEFVLHHRSYFASHNTLSIHS
jgi:hypothetical protein